MQLISSAKLGSTGAGKTVALRCRNNWKAGEKAVEGFSDVLQLTCHFHGLWKGMAGTTGLEPAASAVTGQRSNQLNYVPHLLSSGRWETRNFAVLLSTVARVNHFPLTNFEVVSAENRHEVKCRVPTGSPSAPEHLSMPGKTNCNRGTSNQRDEDGKKSNNTFPDWSGQSHLSSTPDAKSCDSSSIEAIVGNHAAPN